MEFFFLKSFWIFGTKRSKVFCPNFLKLYVLVEYESAPILLLSYIKQKNVWRSDKNLYWSKMEDEHQKGQSDDSTSDGEENYSEKCIIKMYLWK